ncbi:hypothetical protein QVD17_08234 [Tagetes erecta]|uniref:Uncharacterized protein n=1 Tax=Tagetes erecta TaxID=13708 RepID=A0AAD8P347_TARER|nr:hypothetical protein QVD17_08234 [Tagetes erecta]
MLDNTRLLEMDRHVPDCCESTLDSKMIIKRKKRKRHFPATDNLDACLGIDNQRVKRLRLHSSSPSPQNDQVVPQMTDQTHK